VLTQDEDFESLLAGMPSESTQPPEPTQPETAFGNPNLTATDLAGRMTRLMADQYLNQPGLTPEILQQTMAKIYSGDLSMPTPQAPPNWSATASVPLDEIQRALLLEQFRTSQPPSSAGLPTALKPETIKKLVQRPT
jgi:hypothetical protein